MKAIHKDPHPSFVPKSGSNLPSSFGSHSTGGGPAASLLLNKRFTLPFLAVLAALAVGLLFLLPGGLLHAQNDGAIDYAENGTGPVETYTATDPEGGMVSWSLDGTDKGVFTIVDGVLSFKEPPDFEDTNAKKIYSVEVIATDSSGKTGKKAVTVTVTNVDEDGALTLSNRQPVDGVPLDAELTDIDGKPTVETWKWAKSTNGSTWTVIAEAITNTYTPKPADLNNYLRATVSYTDPEGSGKSEEAVSDRMVMSKRSTNTVPVFEDADGSEIKTDVRDVPENSAAGTNVGDPVAASDTEGDLLTYTLSGADAGSFDINRATGQIMVGAGTALDLDGKNNKASYKVNVTATGPGHAVAVKDRDTDTIEVAITITVTNVDEDPELTGPASSMLDENVEITVKLGAYSATDDEDSVDPALTLSGTDAGDFKLENGQLSFKKSPNYESPADANEDNVYMVRVVATDTDDQTDTKDVTVTVTNVKEAGMVSLSTLQPRVGIRVTASVTDLDGMPTAITWQWERDTTGEAGAGKATKECDKVKDDEWEDAEGMGADTAAYTPEIGDWGKCLRATADYTDPQGSDDAEFKPSAGDKAVEEDDTNKAPAFPDQDMETDGDQTDQERTIEENTKEDTSIGDAVKADDPNKDDILTYTLGGDDAASFSIVRTSGQLRTKATLDKETKDTYEVTVTATDPSGLSAAVKVTIKVSNVNESPVIAVGGLVISGLATVSLPEDGMTTVGTYTARGPGASGATWTLEGDDRGDFMIEGSGMSIMLKFNEPPNYEAPTDANMDNVYMVTLKATDGTYTGTMQVTVTVTDVEEPPLVISGLATVSLPEDDTTTVGTYTAAGTGASDATWTLEGDDSGDFMVDGSGMSIVLKFTSSPNYEEPTDANMDNVYMVTLKATDGTNTDTMQVTVTVMDVDEPPVDSLLDRYDADDSGEIEKPEMIDAINDYLFGGLDDAITKAQMIEVINLYLFGSDG